MEDAIAAQQQRILITGAGRGLGLEFARQWLAAGHQVLALARRPEASRELAGLAGYHPGRLHPVACDVASDDSVGAAVKVVCSKVEALDLLVNNAATYGARGGTLKDLDLAEVSRVFEVNAVAPLRVARAFMGLLQQGRSPRLVNVTSLMGSITDNRSGGTWAYRISKTALNMATTNLSLELKGAGVACIAIHPGWVRTDMGGMNAPLAPSESIASMIRTIDGVTMAKTGAILDRDGAALPL